MNVADCAPPSIPRRTNSRALGSFRREKRSHGVVLTGISADRAVTDAAILTDNGPTISSRRRRNSSASFGCVATKIGVVSNVSPER